MGRNYTFKVWKSWFPCNTLVMFDLFDALLKGSFAAVNKHLSVFREGFIYSFITHAGCSELGDHLCFNVVCGTEPLADLTSVIMPTCFAQKWKQKDSSPPDKACGLSWVIASSCLERIKIYNPIVIFWCFDYDNHSCLWRAMRVAIFRWIGSPVN